MTMTREQQIEEAAEALMVTIPVVEKIQFGIDIFRKGARWADDNPKPVPVDDGKLRHEWARVCDAAFAEYIATGSPLEAGEVIRRQMPKITARANPPKPPYIMKDGVPVPFDEKTRKLVGLLGLAHEAVYRHGKPDENARLERYELLGRDVEAILNEHMGGK